VSENKGKLNSKKNEKVSVIIANYNNSKFIEESVLSVLNQTYPNIEIIIVDDCSKDESIKIIKELAKRYSCITPIFNKYNIGVSTSRDFGIRQSTGYFITTLDSDDFYINKKKIASEVEILKLYNKKGKQVVAYSNTVIVDEKGNRLKKREIENNKELNFYNFLTRSCYIPRDMMFTKKAYFEVGGFDPKFKMYEDWDLKIRLIRKFLFIGTGVEGTAYRQNKLGLSKSPIKAHFRWQYLVIRKNIYDLNFRKKVICYYSLMKRFLIKIIINHLRKIK